MYGAESRHASAEGWCPAVPDILHPYHNAGGGGETKLRDYTDIS